MEKKQKKQKDWKGNKVAPFSCNGCSNHSKGERASEDFYASDPKSAVWLLTLEPQISDVLEPFVGLGHLAEPFRKAGKLRAVQDLVDRGYYPNGIKVSYGDDFLQINEVWHGDIVSNPPYSGSISYVKHCLDLLTESRYLALLLKLTFLEGKGRREFFESNPPKRVWVSSSRLLCVKNGCFEEAKKTSSAVAYAWFIWQKGYKGDTVIKWFN